ncbi:hypothetical protein [Pseudomonas sp. H9]|uniref:hypothetical protein n=1 Tax=Pseudomonas sp. H9 TaxID=483968 RepID=UPI001057B188|nr:hypothetical protein [Pseudomonas sp. H9]TDF78365.1 hypothetical protein E1573_23900 [Pseudomonas sp. H9]
MHSPHRDYDDIQKECQEKLRAYNENQAYVFLRNRGYGTDEYHYSLFQRWLDDMLAKRVNYRANRQNELMLLAMQARNQALANERATS